MVLRAGSIKGISYATTHKILSFSLTYFSIPNTKPDSNPNGFLLLFLRLGGSDRPYLLFLCCFALRIFSK
nr:unnamed protein product [Callosobruchus analis]